MSGLTSLCWTARTQDLRFLLGEFCLFTSRVPALVLEEHFTRLPPNPPPGLPPPGRFPAGVEALVIPSQPAATRLPRISLLTGGVRYVPLAFCHRYIEIDGTFDGYLERLPGKARHEMLRKVRRFTAVSGDPIRWREFRRPEEMEEYHRMALAVSRKTYQDRMLDAGLPAGPGFLQELRSLANGGKVRGYLLYGGRQAVAYGYCRGRGDVLLYMRTGYDPAVREQSPGVVLLYLILQSLFRERRFRLLDLGSGEAPWKQAYATASRPCASIYYFRRNPGNMALVGLHWALTGLSDTVARLLARTGLKARVKKMFRYADWSR